jgi:2-keto-3-deoxy-6-phosphogluconate aldolase
MTAKQEKLAGLFKQATIIPVLTIERVEDAEPLARALERFPLDVGHYTYPACRK